jgi:hypothetical protein
VPNIIGFDFPAMREKQLLLFESAKNTLFYEQSLSLNSHLFEDGVSGC